MRLSALTDIWLSIALAMGTAFGYAGAVENGFVNFDDGPYVFEINLPRQGRAAEARPYLLTALKSRPTDPLLLERLGMVEEMQGRLDAALGHYETAAQLVPQAPKIRQHLQRVRGKRIERERAGG